MNGHENCALFILDKIEANSDALNFRNCQGETPLHLASSKGFLTCVEILLSKGADIWVKDRRGRTPLISCAKNDQVADCLEMMLSRLILLSSSQATGGGRGNTTTSNLMMMMMSGQKKTPPTSQKKRLRLNQSQQNSSHMNNTADTFVVSSSAMQANLNSTGLKQPSDTELVANVDQEVDLNKCNRINEQQNLNSTLIMNENATTSSASSDENLAEVCQKEDTINKENLLPVIGSCVGKSVRTEISGSAALKVNGQTCIFENRNLESVIKPRSFSNSSSDSDFY